MGEMRLTHLPLAQLLAWVAQTPPPHPAHEPIKVIQCASRGEPPQAFGTQPCLGNDRAEWCLADEQRERRVAQDVGPTHPTSLIRIHSSPVHEQRRAIV